MLQNDLTIQMVKQEIVGIKHLEIDGFLTKYKQITICLVHITGKLADKYCKGKSRFKLKYFVKLDIVKNPATHTRKKGIIL